MKQKIYLYLKTIPKGKVVTYGQIAEYLGNRRLARYVGNVLHANPDPIGTPCFKVVNRSGKLAAHFGDGIEMQRKRLEADGVEVVDYTVDLNKYQWKPFAEVHDSGDEILLSEYNGGSIIINGDAVVRYLSTPVSEQTAFVREYCREERSEFDDFQHTEFRWTDEGKNSSYTVCFADNAEFRNAFTMTAEENCLINKAGIFVPGRTYWWFVFGNDTHTRSRVDSFRIADYQVRFITAGKVVNMRDMGGYRCGSNSYVKYGMFYRGAALDESISMIDDAAENVFRYLGIKTEIDLRGDIPHTCTGWDKNNTNVFCISGIGYEPMITVCDERRKQFRTVFDAMAEEKNYPFYIHCSRGADRTGGFAYLINGLLGVPYEFLRSDFELTSFSSQGLRSADVVLNESFDEMNRLMLEGYGDGSGNLQKAIENYLENYIGVSRSVLEKIQSIAVEEKPIWVL